MKRFITIVILVILLAALCATAVDYSVDVEAKISDYRGVYKQENGKPTILEGDNQHLLLLAPPEAMDSLGIVLSDGDSLYIEAAQAKGGLLVTKIRLGDAKYQLRDNTLTLNYYDEQSTYRVNPKLCIGCKLCVTQCPVGAISMQKGKAVIDNDKCVSCGICSEGNGKFRGCPVRAIAK